ncbi:MAG: class I SAM-dependent methyltransferase, partial [Desulfobacteraceae bacterium]|nr:class I SAM-dependent methyltransferase [Desulfobacteraceae bacterium]
MKIAGVIFWLLGQEPVFMLLNLKSNDLVKNDFKLWVLVNENRECVDRKCFQRTIGNMEKEIDFNGEWSNEYDDTAPKIIPAYHSIYELTQHLLRDRLNKEAKILVAGVGTGKEIIDCSLNNPRWRFTGFDPAEAMLSIATKKVAAASLDDKISLFHGLIDNVAEKDFDAATSILVMHFLPDDGTKFNFLKGIADKLKPGAIFVLVDLEGEIGSDEYTALNAAWKNQQTFTRGKNDRVNEEFIIREREVQFIPQKRIESLLEEVGFFKIHKFFKAYLFGGYVAIK